MALPKFPLLSETTTNLIIDQLKANFNLNLAEVDNQYSDGLSLERVEDNSIFISDQIQTLSPPSIFVLASSLAYQYTDNPNYLQSEDDYVVVVTAEEVGAEELTKKIYRYARVLFGTLNLIDLQDASSRIKIKLVPQRLNYTQPVTDKLTKQGGKFRMDCVLELKVYHYENNLTA